MTAPPWAPAPDALRNLLLGREIGQPDSVLQGVVDRVTNSLLAELGTAPPPRWEPVASAYVLYAAATQLELSLFPEQQIGNDGPAARYDKLAGAEIARLRVGLGLVQSEDGSASTPAYWSGTVSIGRA